MRIPMFLVALGLLAGCSQPSGPGTVSTPTTPSATVTTGAASGAPSDLTSARAEKVDLCHLTGTATLHWGRLCEGPIAYGHVLNVAASAVPAHANHDDFVGGGCDDTPEVCQSSADSDTWLVLDGTCVGVNDLPKDLDEICVQGDPGQGVSVWLSF